MLLQQALNAGQKPPAALPRPAAPSLSVAIPNANAQNPAGNARNPNSARTLNETATRPGAQALVTKTPVVPKDRTMNIPAANKARGMLAARRDMINRTAKTCVATSAPITTARPPLTISAKAHTARKCGVQMPHVEANIPSTDLAVANMSLLLLVIAKAHHLPWHIAASARKNVLPMPAWKATCLSRGLVLRVVPKAPTGILARKTGNAAQNPSADQRLLRAPEAVFIAIKVPRPKTSALSRGLRLIVQATALP
jgi:hypothetical protein